MNKLLITLIFGSFASLFFACEEHKQVFEVKYKVVCGSCQLLWLDQEQEWKHLPNIEDGIEITWFGQKCDSANVIYIPGDSNVLIKIWVNNVPIDKEAFPDDTTALRYKLG